MCNPKRSKALLLEQLEPRCLLAGVIFWQSTLDSHNGDEPSTARDRNDRLTIVASDSTGYRQHSEARFDRPRDAQRHATPGSDHQIFSLLRLDPPRDNRLRPEFTQPQQKQLEPTNQSIVILQPSIRGVVNPTNIGSVASTSGSTGQPERDSVLNNSTSMSRTLATVANKSESAMAAERARVSTEAVFFASSTNETSLTQQVSNQPLDYLSTIQLSGITTRVTDQDDAIGGSIEMIPLLRHEFHYDRCSTSIEPWELGSDSLQRLRKVANQTNDASAEIPQDAIDLVIANWFGQSTGLIDDVKCKYDFCSTRRELIPSIVDVVLDATFGLHRSVGLIASADIESQSNSIRDAILAAISVQEPLSIEPRTEHAPTRFSGIVCSGAVILAGTFAFAGHHRRNARLASTKQ